jgi:hypothetical protein
MSEEVEPPTEIVILRSVFAERPGTVFFDYPNQCQCPPRNPDRTFTFDPTKIAQSGKLLKYKIADGTHVYNCVINALHKAGFRHTTSSGYNLLWGGVKTPEFLKDFDPY